MLFAVPHTHCRIRTHPRRHTSAVSASSFWMFSSPADDGRFRFTFLHKKMWYAKHTLAKEEWCASRSRCECVCVCALSHSSSLFPCFSSYASVPKRAPAECLGPNTLSCYTQYAQECWWHRRCRHYRRRRRQLPNSRRPTHFIVVFLHTEARRAPGVCVSVCALLQNMMRACALLRPVILILDNTPSARARRKKDGKDGKRSVQTTWSCRIIKLYVERI